MTNKVRAIWNLYKHNKLTKEQLKGSVPIVISKEEYKEITGEEYDA